MTSENIDNLDLVSILLVLTVKELSSTLRMTVGYSLVLWIVGGGWGCTSCWRLDHRWCIFAITRPISLYTSLDIGAFATVTFSMRNNEWVKHCVRSSCLSAEDGLYSPWVNSFDLQNTQATPWKHTQNKYEKKQHLRSPFESESEHNILPYIFIHFACADLWAFSHANSKTPCELRETYSHRPLKSPSCAIPPVQPMV